MTDIQNTPSSNTGIPRSKMWGMFVIFVIFAGVMYSATMYRIKSSGFMGTAQDQLAHPENAAKGSGKLQDSNIKATPPADTPAK